MVCPITISSCSISLYPNVHCQFVHLSVYFIHYNCLIKQSCDYSSRCDACIAKSERLSNLCNLPVLLFDCWQSLLLRTYFDYSVCIIHETLQVVCAPVTSLVSWSHLSMVSIVTTLLVSGLSMSLLLLWCLVLGTHVSLSLHPVYLLCQSIYDPVL